MKKIWIRLWKTFRNGEEEHFEFVADDLSETMCLWLAEKWAEKEPSGHNYGYEFGFEKMNPSVEWIKKELLRREKIVSRETFELNEIYDYFEKL